MSVAMIFPGQGSQSVGMLADLAKAEPVVLETFAEASDCLGYDLWDLCQAGPEERLGQTDHTQPAMLTAGVAVFRAWNARGGAAASVMAGHSLGEYTALVCAGYLDFRQAVSLVRSRGEIMQAAVPAGSGALAAILGLDDETIASVCESAAPEGVVEPVNFNSPGQVVIGGEAAAVDRAIEVARERGARRAVRLQVSVPSHCSLMEGASRHLATLLSGVSLDPSGTPVIHNVDGAPRETDSAVRTALTRQLYLPVRWTQCIAAMKDAGARVFLEMGPGKVLTGLMRRIDRDLGALAVYDSESLDKAIGTLKGDGKE